jgi:uncharacterized protein (TIGR03067 family)
MAGLVPAQIVLLYTRSTPVPKDTIMRFCSILALCFVFVVSMASSGGDEKSELDRVQGTWKAIKAEIGGQSGPQDEVEKLTWSFKDKGFTVLKEGKTEGKGTFKLNSNKAPMWIDLAFTEGPPNEEKALGVYRIEKDILTICFGDERPMDLKGDGKNTILMQFKRVKDK